MQACGGGTSPGCGCGSGSFYCPFLLFYPSTGHRINHSSLVRVTIWEVFFFLRGIWKPARYEKFFSLKPISLIKTALTDIEYTILEVESVSELGLTIAAHGIYWHERRLEYDNSIVLRSLLSHVGWEGQFSYRCVSHVSKVFLNQSSWS